MEKREKKKSNLLCFNNMKPIIPEKAYVTKRAQTYGKSKEIIDSLQEKNKNIIVETIDEKLIAKKPELFQNKKELILDINAGRFIRKCPGTLHAYCCNYYNLDVAEGCPLDCSYCFLIAYKRIKTPVLFVNRDEMAAEISEVLTKYPVLRAGSGELSDSFAFADFDNVHLEMIRLFKKYPSAILELKTKRIVDPYLPRDGYANCVIGWSINSKTVEKEEIGAASSRQRIESAKRMCGRGYTVSFHFDPIVFYPEFEKEYMEIAAFLLNQVPHEKIRWISLGTLRYGRSLKQRVYGFKKDTVLFSYYQQESLDGKLRYSFWKRKSFYKKMYSFIKQANSKIPIYMCMEFPRMWKEVFNINPYNDLLLKEVYGDLKKK